MTTRERSLSQVNIGTERVGTEHEAREHLKVFKHFFTGVKLLKMNGDRCAPVQQ